MKTQLDVSTPFPVQPITPKQHRVSIKLDTRLDEKAKLAKRDEELDWDTETDMELDYE